MSTDELMEFQAVEYYKLQTELREFFESKGRDVSNLTTSWPMIGDAS